MSARILRRAIDRPSEKTKQMDRLILHFVRGQPFAYDVKVSMLFLVSSW
jgi:hypothetical protein